MSDVLTASGLLSRNISVEWHEAVALVRGVVVCLLRDVGHVPVVPELHQIEIAPDGQIDVVGGTRTTEPVRRLGQLLQAMFGQSDPPVQLRLIISQATATSPSFGSIREFDQALGYFERPDRSAVIRALYARAAAAPISGVTSPLTLDTVAPLSNPEEQIHKRIRAAARRRALRVAVYAGAITLICVAGVQYAVVRGLTPSVPDVRANARRVADTVDASVLSGLSAITESAGFGRIVLADAAGEELSADAEASPSPSPGVRPATSSRSSAEAVPGTSTGSQTPAAGVDAQAASVVAFDLDPAPVPPVPAAARAALSNTVAVKAGEADLTTYSVESADVQPPIGVRPVLPTELPPNLRREDLLFIALTVLPDGSVEAVRLLGLPRNMQEGMWLSAVKAFEFLPALKDGVPVRYRKNIWIAPR